MDDVDLRRLIPHVLGVLVRRGVDFADAEDAVQSALVRAIEAWEHDPPRNPTAWLVTASWHAFLDAARSDQARAARERLAQTRPGPGPATAIEDTLELYVRCAHPALTPSSAVALTLRAVGGLTTRQISHAYLVPEATMAQRISRAKATIAGLPLDRAAGLPTLLKVLYLVFNEGYCGSVDLAEEAIRLSRQLAALSDEPEVHGLLALLLLTHARRPARTDGAGRLVPLDRQDRTLWDTALIAEGVEILQRALALDRLGEYQAQAAIAALHGDAFAADDTDWPQIVQWYDELVTLTDSPIARLNRAVALGEADGARVGLAALAQVDPTLPRHRAAEAYLTARAGCPERAATLYAEAAALATSVAERDHLTREAARLRRAGP